MAFSLRFRISLTGILVFFILASCNQAATPIVPSQTVEPTTPANTSTPEPPTATPEPLAAKVNGEGILLVDYQAELKRFQESQTNSAQTSEAQRDTVLDDLVGQALLAQAAAEGGYQVDDAALQKRINQLADQAGGMPALQDWMKRQGYSEDSFARSLRQAIMAAWQRDKIIAAVPNTAEQVRARQILVQDEATAGTLEDQLKGGSDFATMALRYDPVTGGDLGWFPRGYLTQPEVEAAAFELQPNGFSPVIKSAIGYHIIQVIERNPQRPLDADALRGLQEKALQDWIHQRQEQSKIEILVK